MFGYIQEILADPKGVLLIFLLALPGRLLAISAHESAHAWVANRCGDPTARLMGRISLNPLKHLDPVGLLMMVLFGFGWAKPVPVNPLNFKHYRKDDLKVSVAGVTVNLLLFLTGTLLMYGVVAWALARLPYYARDWFVTKDMYRTVYNGVPALVSGGYWYDLTELMRYGTSLSDILIAPVFGKVAGYFYQMLAYFVTTNLVLAVFNLIPLPPLDGYHVLNDLVLKRPVFADVRSQQVGTLLLLAGVLTGVLDKELGWVYSGVMDQIGALFTWLFELIKLM